MIRKTQNSGLISGLVPHLIPCGVCILHYADDTIIFFLDDMEMARNLKLLLYLFEAMPNLKINFQKSGLLMDLEDSVKLEEYASVFRITLLFRYR